MFLKYFCFAFSFFILANSYSQNVIEGQWLSVDQKRVYHIYLAKQNTYEAKLIFTRRENESNGNFILRELKFNPRRKRYEGYINSVIDSNLVRFVKIKIKSEGKLLQLTIPRMMVLPVRIKWYRMRA
ncbi:MAG: hypothetical protein K2X48_16070 [Chitinophagaceae bacterium]|nr:hypothetical protein [Chitinophagaceae bacterium]